MRQSDEPGGHLADLYSQRLGHEAARILKKYAVDQVAFPLLTFQCE